MVVRKSISTWNVTVFFVCVWKEVKPSSSQWLSSQLGEKMALEIPEDLIKRVQISLRREANLASYNPDDTSLPNLPSLQQTLSQLDPSPPYLRCKHCKARLLRGIQSLICVFCGRHHHLDPIPDPLVFRNTFACRWFLDSLDLDGSVRLCFYVSIYVFLFNYNVNANSCFFQKKKKMSTVSKLVMEILRFC